MTSAAPTGIAPGSQLAGRYTVLRSLGGGAFGHVYEAEDAELGRRVALKQLRSVDPHAIHRFKKEFRAFSDVVHPNLVRLHELFVVQNEWYLSMDLVDGRSFLEHVAGDAARLRAGLAQLVAGVRAIHAAGRLHRDLKPANVLVTPDDRLLILDFGLGLVAQQAPTHDDTLDDGDALAGTPDYMAPEQAAGAPASEASDWYAVGVMLYQALVGRLPFAGSGLEVLRAKRARDPDALPPAELMPDLASLSAQLLARDPAARPSGDEIARRVGLVPARPPATIFPPPSSSSSRSGRSPFFGRDVELAALHEAWAVARSGRAVLVHLHGPSGMGKSTLARRFLSEVRRGSGAVVLAGRCYERESMPYKALDGLMDALARHLATLPTAVAEARLPRHMAMLARLFPAMRRVDAVERAAQRFGVLGAPHEVRRLGFGALRELLARECERAPLAVHLDDLQWGDTDSAELLLDVLAPPDPPPLLLLASYRSEDVDESALVVALRRGTVEAREVAIGPLDGVAAQAMARALVDDDAVAEVVARESGGSPFFLHELARQAHAEGGPAVRLNDLLARRLARVGGRARRLLEVLSVAAGPIAVGAARQAAGLAADGGEVDDLRRESLLRTRGTPRARRAEPFHDRVREAVLASLPADVLSIRHREVAEALEREGVGPELLAAHYRAAGDVARAVRFGVLAAERATAALAFERAAQLLRAALDLEPGNRALLAPLGAALANAGRGREAAQAFLMAVDGAPAGEARLLRRSASEQLLQGGWVDEGMQLMRGLLDEAGLGFPSTPRRAVATMIWHRLRLRMRGLELSSHALATIPRERIDLIDACWAVGLGLCNTDIVRGMGYLSLHLRLALDAGEPSRAARGLGIEAMVVAGGGDLARAAELAARSEALARRAGTPAVTVWPAIGMAVIAFTSHRWREAHQGFGRVLELAAQHGAGGWEVGTARHFAVMSLVLLGDLEELARVVPRDIRDARDRGDLYTETNTRAWGHSFLLLVHDQVDDAADELTGAMARWTRVGFHIQHYYELLSRVEIALYRGEGPAAYEIIVRGFSELRRSQILNLRILHVRANEMRGRAALAAASVAKDRAPLLADAEAQARWLAGERMAYPEAAARLLRAGVAHLAGDPARAALLLAEAERNFTALDMALVAHALRRRRGELEGGAAGRALVESADDWMRARGVTRPDRVAAMLVPGFA